MKKVKGLIAAVLAAGMVMMTVSASAADGLDGIPWITVSSWAYPDVSNFRSAVEMPEMFADVTDYTQPVNRVQTANLLYKTLVASGEIYDYVEYGNYKNRFEDTDDPAAGVLKDYDIMRGEPTGEDEYGYTLYNFYPDRPLTREEFAAVLCRAVGFFRQEILEGGESISAEDIADYGDISDYAKEDVLDVMGCGLMNGVGGGKFAPKDNLTIEQTIVTLYRLFQQLPMTPGADGAALPDGQELKRFENGVTEERNGNTLYLKRGADTLMEFETDIYENVFCADNNGVTYAAAENMYDRTDVYNADTKELLFRIPYPVYGAQSDYIITKSSDTGKCTFGLYGYDGNEALEPKYSLNEIDILKANDFTFPAEEKAASTGWIYYADWGDGGHMCRIDANGENKQKLSDNDCFDIEYVNGWLYYSVRGADENKLYAMRADGKYEQRLTDEFAGVVKCGTYEYTPGRAYPDMGHIVISGGNVGTNGMNLGDIIIPYFDGEWVYYFETVNEYKTLGNLWRVRMNEDGTAVKEKVSDEIFACDNLHNSSTTSEHQLHDGKLYIQNADKDKLYIYGGGEKVIEGNINEFGFCGDKLVLSRITDETDKNGKRVSELYIAEPDGSDMRIWQEWYDADAGKSEAEPQEDPQTGEKIYKREAADYGGFKIVEYGIEKPYLGGTAGRAAGFAIRTPDGRETLVTDELIGGRIVNIGDVLYYAKYETEDGRSSGALWAYDVNTGSNTRIAGGVMGIAYGDTAEKVGKWVLYTDTGGNVWRYSIADKKLSEVYPNANLKKHGELAGWFNRTMDKIDTDGDFTTIADEEYAYGIYVPNGLPVDVTP